MQRVKIKGTGSFARCLNLFFLFLSSLRCEPDVLVHTVGVAFTANLAGICIGSRLGGGSFWCVSPQHRQWLRRGSVRLPEQADRPVHEEAKGHQQVPHEEVSPAAVTWAPLKHPSKPPEC